MKRSHTIAAVMLSSLSFGMVATIAHAHPTGNVMGPGMMAGTRHGAMGGVEQGSMAGPQLMTPDERTAFHEKMRSGKTPEERQELAESTHAEMQKRAQENGITVPEHRGPHGGFGPGTGMR